MAHDKLKIYSFLPRLLTNSVAQPRPNGSIEENGTGKLEELTTELLSEVKKMGFTHLWPIGIIEHASRTSYEGQGIPPSPPETVKGEAGSPYAIRDYYAVDPDLAVDVGQRKVEFVAFLDRAHWVGLKVLIDFVPNHVARVYHGKETPTGISPIGAKDNVGLSFSTENHFYYIEGEALHLPLPGSYQEYPAKVTGNDCFSAYPSINDWYETVKINYGRDYLGGRACYAPQPRSWQTMLEILRYWLALGVDGFRCDMVEMVPVAFWRWALPQLKREYSGACFLAEVYQPALYEAYISAGFDYLYDKVGMYDLLRHLIGSEDAVHRIHQEREARGSLLGHMCYFLENHDEQRIASDFFASDPFRALPALAVSLLVAPNPYLHYFGQELGERGMDAEGFSGRDGRTTIFDYWSLDKLRRWQKAGWQDFELSPEEQQLRGHYLELLSWSDHPAIEGGYWALPAEDILAGGASHRIFAFFRYAEGKCLLVLTHFSAGEVAVQLRLSPELLEALGLEENCLCQLEDRAGDTQLKSFTTRAPLKLHIPAKGYQVLEVKCIKKQ